MDLLKHWRLLAGLVVVGSFFFLVTYLANKNGKNENLGAIVKSRDTLQLAKWDFSNLLAWSTTSENLIGEQYAPPPPTHTHTQKDTTYWIGR